MSEPEQRLEGGEAESGLFPILLLLLALLWVGALIAVGWHEAYGDPGSDWLLRIHIAWLSLVTLVFVLALSGRGSPREVPAEPEAWICQHCLKPYVPGAHFCPRCGAPKTFFSGTGQYERIYAQAWGLGKAARYPSRLLHVIGLFALAAPTVLGAIAWIVLWSLQTFGARDWAWIDASVPVVTSFMGLIYTALLVMCLLAWRRRRRGLEPATPEIEYGAPPWFSFDTEWALPEFEEEPDGEEERATPETG